MISGEESESRAEMVVIDVGRVVNGAFLTQRREGRKESRAGRVVSDVEEL